MIDLSKSELTMLAGMIYAQAGSTHDSITERAENAVNRAYEIMKAVDKKMTEASKKDE